MTVQPSSRPPRTRTIAIGAALLIAAVVAVGFVAVLRGRLYPPAISTIVAPVESPTGIIIEPHLPSTDRSVIPYAGLGTWLDAFDYSPAYNVEPDIGSMVADMQEAGIETIFVQSGRLDERSPDLLEDRWVLTELLLHAHQRDIAVVAWFLPKWGAGAEDLDHLLAASEFSVFGHRFDGVAVDIEWNQDGLDADERSARLVALSDQLDQLTGADPLGAIVMPPVLLEVINTQFWPDFPWDEIEDNYDVWLPMSYWSFRSNESGYGGGYEYNFESTWRLRNNLNDPDALVHGIGGVGATIAADRLDGAEPIASVDDLALFAQSLADSGSIGGSIYDWQTSDQVARDTLQQLFLTGSASDLTSVDE